MSWLDRYIDWTYQSYSETTVGSLLPDFGPFSRLGSIANILVCVLFVGVTLWTGFTGSPFWLGATIFAAAIGIVLVRVCFRAFRGDFEDFVIPSDDDDQ
jgi:hypothetical protein